MNEVIKILKNYLPELFYLIFRRKIPNAVTVNITDKCNQNCIYCEIGKGIITDRKDRLNKQDLKWLIDEMYSLKIKRLALCGGEPLLFEGLFEIIDYAGKKNVTCSVTTNGMLIKDLNEQEIQIFKRNKTQINISADSFDDIIESSIRGNYSSVETIKSSVKRLTKESIPVTMLCVVSRFNYNNLFEYFAKAYEIGVSCVLFQPVITFSNYPDRNTIPEKSQLNVSPLNIEKLLFQFNKILNFEKKHRIKTNVYRLMNWIPSYLAAVHNMNKNPFYDSILKKFYCRDVHAIIDIAYDGGIQPCGLMPATISIKEKNTKHLIHLWENATETLKKRLSESNYPEVCRGCCHHFSRNMIASVIKYPLSNRRALFSLINVLLFRFISISFKKILFVK